MNFEGQKPIPKGSTSVRPIPMGSGNGYLVVRVKSIEFEVFEDGISAGVGKVGAHKMKMSWSPDTNILRDNMKKAHEIVNITGWELAKGAYLPATVESQG